MRNSICFFPCLILIVFVVARMTKWVPWAKEAVRGRQILEDAVELPFQFTKQAMVCVLCFTFWFCVMIDG